MIWQDFVIASVSLMFGFILLPQLKDVISGKTTLNLASAGLTTVGLYVLGLTFITLDLWVSVISEFFSATVWLLLFVFSYSNYKKNKS